uniref:Uncharacterized LOC107699387 n=1 Tax=Sinocyclocheilus anshuiensis TaxID=1608454 RepID=A0A671P0S8_9TELE
VKHRSVFASLCSFSVDPAFSHDNLATGRTVTQSSTFGHWSADHAIDFNPGLTNSWSSCSSTIVQTNPWWRVDLRYIYRVSRVVITNILDCCAERINGAEIRIGNSLENNGNNNPICAVISSIPAGVSSTYICNNMEGRYVNLFIPGYSKYLTLCEVEVYGEGNWASRGAATQSSTSADWFAEKAIDGKPGLQSLRTGCSSTLNQTNPWWRLDLSSVYRVSKVVVTNRNDCCTKQMKGVEIRIGNSLENNGNDNPICAVIPAIPAGESYMNLIIPGNMKTLTLCEVEVFGEGMLYLYYLLHKKQLTIISYC